jgi:hypothetical protein
MFKFKVWLEASRKFDATFEGGDFLDSLGLAHLMSWHRSMYLTASYRRMLQFMENYIPQHIFPLRFQSINSPNP